MNCEPVGKMELAKVLAVKPRTVHVWRDRDQLPPPDYPSVNGSPAWEKSTMLLWALRTGRAKGLSKKDQSLAKKLLASLADA